MAGPAAGAAGARPLDLLVLLGPPDLHAISSFALPCSFPASQRDLSWLLTAPTSPSSQYPVFH